MVLKLAHASESLEGLLKACWAPPPQLLMEEIWRASFRITCIQVMLVGWVLGPHGEPLLYLKHLRSVLSKKLDRQTLAAIMREGTRRGVLRIYSQYLSYGERHVLLHLCIQTK